MALSNDFDLSTRRVLVTGGSRGIGLAIANAMSKSGAEVVIAARNVEHLASSDLLEESISAIQFDVLDVEKISSLLDEVERTVNGQVTTVVHAAGTQHRQRAESFDVESFRRVLDVNLVAPFALSREIGFRQLSSKSAGQHIFIGSLTSFISLPQVSAYGASKAGVLGLVRALSSEWAGFGIRVNGIAPGYIRTALTEAVFADEDRREQNLRRIPMDRFGEPSDIAGAAVFLASDASSYVTGQMLAVDGGWLSS